MQRKFQITCTLVFVAAIAAAFLHEKSYAVQSPAREIDCDDSDKQLLSELNDRVQERFKDIDDTFGYRRIIRAGDTPHRFKPENAKELKIVDELNKARLKVALYLASRNVTKINEHIMRFQPGQFIKGPGLITADDKQRNGLPQALEMFEQSRKAMAAFEKSDSYDFTLGGWKFTARPVRASEESCLACHNGGANPYINLANTNQPPERLKIGDVLGVVIYAHEYSR
jgi:Protein of unknown function (DUF3365)